MYVRTKEEALDALAEILALPDPRQQAVQATVKIMLCLDLEPRQLLADCQTILWDGGLEGLRQRRRDAIIAAGGLALTGIDPGEEELFHAVGTALDGLRLAPTVRQVFPDLRYERWQVARALLEEEAALRSAVAGTLRARADAAGRLAHQEALEDKLLSLHRVWMDRAGTLRAACLDTLKLNAPLDVDRLHEEADLVFSIFATSDARAVGLLSAVDQDPVAAVRQILKVYELSLAVRRVNHGPAGPGDADDARQVA
jgi:hypothetical protein